MDAWRPISAYDATYIDRARLLALYDGVDGAAAGQSSAPRATLRCTTPARLRPAQDLSCDRAAGVAALCGLLALPASELTFKERERL